MNISTIVDSCTDAKLKSQLEKLAEVFKFSDPVSSDETESVEADIVRELDELRIAVKSNQFDAASSKISVVRNLLSERNRICKCSKK